MAPTRVLSVLQWWPSTSGIRRSGWGGRAPPDSHPGGLHQTRTQLAEGYEIAGVLVAAGQVQEQVGDGRDPQPEEPLALGRPHRRKPRDPGSPASSGRKLHDPAHLAGPWRRPRRACWQTLDGGGRKVPRRPEPHPKPISTIFVTDQRRLIRQPRHSVNSGFAPPGARVVSPRSEDRQECGGSPKPRRGKRPDSRSGRREFALVGGLFFFWSSRSSTPVSSSMADTVSHAAEPGWPPSRGGRCMAATEASGLQIATAPNRRQNPAPPTGGCNMDQRASRPRAHHGHPDRRLQEPAEQWHFVNDTTDCVWTRPCEDIYNVDRWILNSGRRCRGRPSPCRLCVNGPSLCQARDHLPLLSYRHFGSVTMTNQQHLSPGAPAVRRRCGRSGQAMVELAIILPLMVLPLLALDRGRSHTVTTTPHSGHPGAATPRSSAPRTHDHGDLLCIDLQPQTCQVDDQVIQQMLPIVIGTCPTRW